MACVGIGEATGPRVEDTVETGDEHVGRDAGSQRLIDSPEHLPRRVVRSLSDGPEHTAGGRHHERCRHTLARCVPHNQAQATVFQLEEVIEVSSYLPGRSVARVDIPTLERGHRLGQRSLLDAPSNVQLLFDAFAGLCLLLETLLTGLYFPPHEDRRRNLRNEVGEANHIFAIRSDLWVVHCTAL